MGRFQQDDRPIDASSVASQAGTALDNLILAEEMAERLEAERHARALTAAGPSEFRAVYWPYTLATAA